ncbi:MAG: hypothetical protein PHR14_08520 [Oscillospiraceae bacterium]|nr:hypothetical protein [Oscillospiraceae bacterium]
MVNIYILKNGSFHITDEIQDGAWINLSSPTMRDTDNISSLTQIDRRYFTDAAAANEIEKNKTVAVSFLNIENEKYRMILSDKYVITVCQNHDSGELRQFIKGMISMIEKPGFVNVDIKDLFNIINKSENMYMVSGCGTGGEKTGCITETILASSNTKTLLSNTTGILMTLFFSPNVKLDDINNLVETMSKNINSDAVVVWGAVLDASLEDEIKLTLAAAA